MIWVWGRIALYKKDRGVGCAAVGELASIERMFKLQEPCLERMFKLQEPCLERMFIIRHGTNLA